MRVILPSNGILGCKQVDLRQPKFSDIRNIQNFNQEEDLVKAYFTKQLLPMDFDLSKITKFDLDYLFAIVAYACQFNVAQYTVTCECSHKIRKEVCLAECEVIDIKKFKLPHYKIIDGQEVKYTILSAKQHIEACEYAIMQDDYKTAYEDAITAFILSKTLDDIEEVKSLNMGIYLSAHLFHNVNFHGVNFLLEDKCPSCGKMFRLDVTPTSEFVNISIEDMMRKFANVSAVMDFDTFVDFTIPEFKAFIDAMNSKVK